ncbi:MULTISPECIES: hypothetical protein [Psychrilyobacter]|uniref:Uncharacterized protein n=1 Tax=Psychrilyobacter piezotolerans TaxID=2293438 RepID=A0ABX9KD95_9FUSO|nr:MULTISPECIES: hypothetical protein [Psychrilyobacter]MCS5423243.1 hypothetical protein [Psychrilyobacter sp. S5]NDI79146.1 hypothetical protein [Psychrilyobacter piezotolerans]RDE58944.1 hypothetical protein DV867_14615 [Psychrilyobacter sp. S5]REI39500.1 hypothetical protein DYH56_14615 [Psychrilyobacter piezotolerans]
MLDLSKLLGFDRVNIKTSIKNYVEEHGIEYEGVKIISANKNFIVLETSENAKIILATNSIQYVEEFIPYY